MTANFQDYDRRGYMPEIILNPDLSGTIKPKI